MARSRILKSSSRRRLIRSRYWRDNFPIANRSRLPVSQSSYDDLSVWSDRRLWHPSSFQAAETFSGRRYFLREVPRVDIRFVPIRKQRRSSLSLKSFVSGKIAFGQPDRVLVCVRRSRRREVLHALNLTGRRGQRKPRFNSQSSISCKVK